jgi:hypothetical protein
LESLYIAPSIIQNHIETPRQCNDEFLGLTICVAASFLSAWHIINPKNALYFERDMTLLLNKREIASLVENLR